MRKKMKEGRVKKKDGRRRREAKFVMVVKEN